MPEEATPQAPEETQDTPPEAAPEQGTPAKEPEEPTVDYEQRYNDLRPEFDRATQEREQHRQEALAWQILAGTDEYDHDQIQAAADYLGVELADEEEETEDEDPYDQRLSKLEQAQNAQDEAENQRLFDNHLDELAEGAEVELSKRDRRLLLIASHENGFSPEATEEAFKEFLDERKAHDKAVIDGYRKSKNTPHVSSVGGPMTTEDKLPLDASRAERQAWQTERFQQALRQD